MRVEEEHLDVLQNIESAIVAEFRADGAILDLNAADAIGELIRRYQAEINGRTPPEPRLSALSRKIFVAAGAICDLRLGRPAASPGPGFAIEPGAPPKTLEDIVACLKRIQKSIGLWSNQGGKRGYLEFVSNHVR